MICPKCGAQMPDEIKFCTQCGTPIEPVVCKPVMEEPAVAEIPETPAVTEAPAMSAIPEEPAPKHKAEKNGKLTLAYVLIAALIIAQIFSFVTLRKENRRLSQELNETITNNIDGLTASMHSEIDKVNKSIESNGKDIQTVSDNLDTLQEDHAELERTITEKVNAVSVAQKCANAVFYIEMYDDDGWCLGSGSGFFIDPSGIAVTNYHVIDGCTSATVMLANGNVYDIIGVYDYNIEKDIALIQVDGEGFDILPLGDSEGIVAGEEVYAIGSPSGLDNTISTGIISNVKRYVDGMDYIQFTAPISCGSSGGALLDETYSVIGITSAYWIGTGDNGTQNLNLAIPISLIDELDREDMETLGEVYASNNVFSDAYLYVSDYYVILPPDGSALLTVYESTGDPDVTLRYEIDDSDIADAEWGDWIDDNTSEITITALSEGSTTVWFYLLDADKNVICTDYMYLDVTSEYEDVELSCEPQMLTVKVGETAAVRFHEGLGLGGEYLWYSVAGGNVECEWGDWMDDNYIELYITGATPGTDTVTVSLFDENDNFYKSIQVQILVE